MADEFQPGSRKRVLKNKLGITSQRAMVDEEIVANEDAAAKLITSLDLKHRFTARDVKQIHREIFGKLYEWAGEYRSVDLSKGELMFTRAIFINEHMNKFSREVLEKQTPPGNIMRRQLTLLLAQIHDELILIHPFREGNGRTVRLLINLIAQQAGYGGLDFSSISASRKSLNHYFGAVRAGMKLNYEPMRGIIDRALF